jgi:flagellar biosynthesis protein FlhB
MQDEEKPGDKPYDPTPRKLEEARERGEIVRSQDLNTAVTYAGFLAAGFLLWPWTFETLGLLMQAALGQAPTLSSLMLSPGGMAAASGLLAPSFLATFTILAAPAAVVIVALVAQRGLLFTPSNLAPKLSRISPISNAKTKFGAEGLFQFAKSAAKLIIVSILLGLHLWARADQIVASVHAAPGQILALIGWLTVEFMAVVLALSLVIGGIDWLWERNRHLLRHRMSRQELLDETKSSEGDPYMKQERRQRAQLIAGNRMMGEVPEADVVVVNPTHYAVALKWERARGQVPVCVAKGVDEVAARIRAVAAEAGVPVFSDPATARALFATVDIGAPILPDQYKAVAAAIRFSDEMRRRARRAR